MDGHQMANVETDQNHGGYKKLQIKGRKEGICSKVTGFDISLEHNSRECMKGPITQSRIQRIM